MPTSTTRMIQWRVNRHTRWGGSNFPTVKEVAERATSESDLTAEGKKRRWLINGSAREEGPMGRLPRLGSPGPSTGDVKTRLAASSSFQRGPVSVLRAPLHSWPRISRRSTENPPPIVGLFCPVSPGRAMRYLWVSFGGLCRSRHYTGSPTLPSENPDSPSAPLLVVPLFSDGHWILSLSFYVTRVLSRNFTHLMAKTLVWAKVRFETVLWPGTATENSIGAVSYSSQHLRAVDHSGASISSFVSFLRLHEFGT